uniref:Uncharacterized protein n=1 Tax=Serratia plymuthica TaxID=82996 RepID=K7WYY8_SERPL|nr:Hypothetical protein [Serratia plymuthica]
MRTRQASLRCQSRNPRRKDKMVVITADSMKLFVLSTLHEAEGARQLGLHAENV